MTTNVHVTGSKKPYNLVADAGVTANGNGPAAYKDGVFSTFQARVVGTGAVTATVVIQVSNSDDIANPVWCITPLGTITLSGATDQSDGFATQAAWRLVRAVVSNVTGTGATVTVLMSN